MKNSNGSIPGVGEVLEAIVTYRALLVQERGEEWVRNYPISDEWGDGMTTTALLLRNPHDNWYVSYLHNEETRERVYNTVLALQEQHVKA